ncbi:MAG: 2,3-bisphosphoglycerate-independent phosphoglycerate mutase, partial [Oscillospiraceae bacterium]
MIKPVVLCIMDGYAISNDEYGNAIKSANTPNLDKLFSTCPNTTIGASGLNVGLPDGQMGNSEVGHTNIGAGRIVYQELTRISKSIEDGDFFDNAAFIEAIENVKKNGTALHLMGLLSDGGVHSHNTHLYALIEMAKRHGINDVFVHCFMDGRDVPPTSGKDFVAELQNKMNEIGVGKISTVIGRYYAMDRDNRFERVVKAYDAIVNGKGNYADDPVSAIEKSYEETDADGKNITDEFIVPTICCKNGNIKENDSVIFFNFRPDRAREITRTLVDPDFVGFERKFFNVFFVCLTQYDATMPNVTVAFRPQSLNNTLGQYLSSLDKKQLRIAETEKYAHVTFFFNGGVESVNDGEDRILVSSPKVSTYDL